MRPTRRLILSTLPIAALPARAQAPAWPDRPLRLIVPTQGGAGTADTIARIMAAELEKHLAQRVLVENRAGANGNVGAAAVARAYSVNSVSVRGPSARLTTRIFGTLPTSTTGSKSRDGSKGKSR